MEAGAILANEALGVRVQLVPPGLRISTHRVVAIGVLSVQRVDPVDLPLADILVEAELDGGDLERLTSIALERGFDDGWAVVLTVDTSDVIGEPLIDVPGPS